MNKKLTSIILMFVFTFAFIPTISPNVVFATQPELQAPWEGIKIITQGNNDTPSHNNHYDRYAIDVSGSFEVLATFNGRIAEIVNSIPDDTGKNWGNFISIQHNYNGYTFYSIYCHLKQYTNTKNINDEVQQGEVIAISGNTGYSTNPHLHFKLATGSSASSDSIEIEEMWLKQIKPIDEQDSEFKPYRKSDFNGDIFASRYVDGKPVLIRSYESNNSKTSGGGGGGGDSDCKLPAPTDLSPADGAEVKNDSKLRWKQVEGKTNYTLYFYNSPKEDDFFGSKKQPQDNEFTIRDDQGFVDGKKYYWRVAANCSGDKPGTYSVYQSFIFKSSSGGTTCHLPPPELIYPADGAEMKVGEYLRWKRVGEEKGNYSLYFFDKNHQPHQKKDPKICEGEDFTLSEDQDFVDGEKYYWRVHANCTGNVPSSHYSERSFIFKASTTPPPSQCKAPELYYPLKDALIDLTKPIVFEWEAVGTWDLFIVKAFRLNIYYFQTSSGKLTLLNSFNVTWLSRSYDRMSFTIPSEDLKLEPNTQYYWSVASICENNEIVESPERRPFTIKAPPSQPPVKAPLLNMPKNGAFYELNISFYSAIRGMSAKYPDGLDRSNISFKFMLEITNKEGFRQNDESEWLNEQLRETNLQEWLSKKAYNLWFDLFLGEKRDEKVEYTFTWHVIARNDISLEIKQSDAWVMTLVDCQPPPDAPILLTPGSNNNDEVYSLSDPVCYSALRSMSAKYPDDKDHTYISFQFQVEIIGKGIRETSEWVDNWDDENTINWPPTKIIDYWRELFAQKPLPEVDLTFQWRVTARNNITMQEKTSEYWTFKIVHKAKCIAPKQIKPKDGESIKLPFYFEWEKVEGAKEYKLQIYNHKKEEVVASYTTTGTTYQVSSLDKNRYYYWTITTICSNGTEEESSFLRFLAKELCKVPIPKEPTGNIFEIRPEFIWEGASDISKYIIEIDGTAYDCNQDSPKTFDWDLRIGPHQWRIKAVCSQGEGDWSDKLSFTIEETPCEIPTPLSPSGRISENQPNFYWSRVENILYYQLELKGQGLDGIIDIKDRNGKALNPPIYFGTAFENGRYKWRVRTICKNGTSGWSNYLEFIVDADGGGQGCKLPAPTLISPSDNAEVTLSFQVKWSYVQGNKGYKLRLYGHNYDLLWEKTVHGESYTFSSMNEFKYGADGYRWSVATICPNGQVGSESQKRTFWLNKGSGNSINIQKYCTPETSNKVITEKFLPQIIQLGQSHLSEHLSPLYFFRTGCRGSLLYRACAAHPGKGILKGQ